MALQHTVVFRLVHAPGSAEEAEFLATARELLTGIPGVADFVVHRQVSAKSDMAWQFSMMFADADAYAAYDQHPVHVDFVATRWVPEIAAHQEYDFEVHA